MKDERVNELDLLRFLAALSVVFFHYSFRGYAAHGLSVMPYPLLAPYSKYGYLGVELFFMISGFVILMTAASGSLRRFVVSRLVRLYPAFWACCTITFVAILAFGKPRFTAQVKQWLANMTLLSGFAHVSSIDGAYWSLFVEIRFYALVAVILFIGRIHQAQLFLNLWLFASIALCFLSLSGFMDAVPWVNLVSKLSDYLIVDYSALFIAGATYYLIWSQGVTLPRVLVVVVSWCLATFQSIYVLKDFENDYNTNMSHYMVASLVTFFFVAMLLVSLRRTGFLGRNRWILLGSLTYPLYLIHQNIGYIIFNMGYPALNSNVLFWGTIICVLMTAYIVHNYVEKKISSPMKSAINKVVDSIQSYAASLYERAKRQNIA